MTHLCTFTDSRMTISANNLVESAMKYGVDHAKIFKPENLSHDFITMALPTINVSRGAGNYIWKPYIVWQMMNMIKDGEYLIYADAGQTIVSNVQEVIQGMDQDIMFFSNGWKHVEWCKADVYKEILGWNNSFNFEGHTRYGKAPVEGGIIDIASYKQTQASLIFFKVTPETRNFVKEWMFFCLTPGFCDDSPSKLPNYPTFAETRHDQAILCCLQIKYGYKLHWLPVLTAMHIKDEYPNDNYPAISDFHRKRNDEW